MLQVNETGLITERLNDILTRMSAHFRAIYGSDININPDSPDGQMIGIFSQGIADINDVIQFAYAMLDPNAAVGSCLEQRVAYAGLNRKQGRHTYCHNVELKGTFLAQTGMVFTDKADNEWVLDKKTTVTDSTSVTLRSIEFGVFTIQPGELFTPKIVTLGYEYAKATQASFDGSLEESDGELRVRFMQSHSVNNNDDKEGLQAALLSVDDVTQAVVLENYTSEMDANGVPDHSLNAIVQGGLDEDIAMTILKKKLGGCGVVGQTVVSVIHKDLPRKVRFDRPTPKSMTASITMKRTAALADLAEQKIKDNVMAQKFRIGEDAFATSLICHIGYIDGFSVQEVLLNDMAVVPVGVRELAQIDAVDIVII